MPGPPLGPSYRTTTTSPGVTRPERIASTASSWDSTTTAAADVPGLEPLGQRVGMHRVHVLVEQAGALQLTEDRGDAAGAVHVLHEVRTVRRDLAEARHPAGELLDVLEGEVELGLLCRGE